MRELDLEDLIDLSLGATILGSGGGGSPEYDLLMAEKHLEEYGKTRLADVTELKDDDLVVPIAFGGAPLVSSELLPSGRECDELLHLIQRLYGKKPTHLMPAEIGGANALTPFLYASRLDIPVLDADTIGRAFPELQMTSCHLMGVSPNPAFVVDVLGNSVIINAKDAPSLEMIGRKNIVAMGSSALMGLYLMDGMLAKKSVIQGTISQAINIGMTIRASKAKGDNPLDELENHHGVRMIDSGVIDNIDQKIEEGFLKGTVSIIGNNKLTIAYQNEYLKVESESELIAVTPEIITLVDSESFLPITSEKLLFGMRVTVIALPAPALWMTEAGLKVVGPKYFGYEDI